jgi:benzoylformate decarboxylase
VVDLAEAAGARVHGEMLACEVNFPTEHDQWISFLPPVEGLGSMLLNTDTLAFVGTSTNTTLLNHEGDLVPPDATTVHVSQDVRELGKNEHTDAAVVGDPGRVMRQLAERVGDRLDGATREQRAQQVAATKASLADTMESMGEDPKEEGETRASKAQLVDAMREVDEDVYVVDEGVTAKYALLTRFPLAAEQYISNKGGGLGYGLPASVGAALAESMREDPRTVVGYIGDGSYLYYPHAIYSATRYDLDLTVVVPDNRNYRILKENTAAMMGGDPEDYEYVGMDFDPGVDLVANAESHGARGHLVETPAEITGVYERALAADGVDVLDVLVHD